MGAVAIAHQKSGTESAGQNMLTGCQHGIGIHHNTRARSVCDSEMTIGAEALYSRSIGSNKPLTSDRNNRGNPVVLENRGCSGEILADVISVQNRQSSKGSGQQAASEASQSIDVVIYQTLKGVKTMHS